MNSGKRLSVSNSYPMLNACPLWVIITAGLIYHIAQTARLIG